MKSLVRTLLAIAVSVPVTAFGQDNIRKEPIPFGDFERWTTRIVKESAIFGGDSIKMYEIDIDTVIRGNKAFKPVASPWSTSNAYAEIMGVVKTSYSVQPSKGHDGLCAELKTRIMSFSIMNAGEFNVLIPGTIYLGEMIEPIKGMKDPWSNTDAGIPFSKKPDCLIFDYKSEIPNKGIITECDGGRISTQQGYDKARILVILQSRKEEKGKITALRVATAEMLIDKTTDWEKDVMLPLTYGKLQNTDNLCELGRLNSIFHAKNSRGKIVPVTETGWAPEGTAPTHLIVYISSGSSEVFTGEVGCTLWIDNISLGYRQ